MTNVLLLTSSPRGEASLSRQVATEFVEKIEDAKVTVRELWRNPPPHIDPVYIQAVFTPEDQRTPEQRKTLALSDELIAELKAADVLVIATGMINFGIHSTLKSWIDHVTRVGLTFKYTESGPVGFLTETKTVLVMATGGVYSIGPVAAMNHLEPHLRTTLGFVGLKDIETIVIEGVGKGPEAIEKALAAAREKAATLAVSY